MQTLHPREKVCIQSACENVQTFNKSAECANCRLFQKMYAFILHKVCKVCTCSAASLQANDGFVWEQPVVGKNADLMHTKCRTVQNYCRHNADFYISVQFTHFFVVIAKFA